MGDTTLDKSTLDGLIEFKFGSDFADDPTRLDLVALSRTGRSLDAVAKADLREVRWVTDLYRGPSGGWRPLAVPPQLRRMYSATGHHTVVGDVAMRPVRYGVAVPLLADQALDPPARVASAESAHFAATAVWLAEIAFDLSRPGEYQRPPMVLSHDPAVRSAMATAVSRHLITLGVAREEAARLTERMFRGPAYSGTSVIEVRPAPDERVTGYGRTVAVLDLPADVDPRQVASALLRRGMPRPAWVPPSARGMVANELLSSGPAIAEELAGQLAVPVAGEVSDRALLDVEALLYAEVGWTPVPSLARLAHAVRAAPEPGVALVRLRAPDHSEKTSALVATREGVRWIDLAQCRPLPAGEIPDFVRHAESATVLSCPQVRNALWSPIAAPVAPPLKIRLGGELLHLIDEHGPELATARGFGYEVAARLAPPTGASPTIIELMTLFYDQLSALLLSQIGPASPTFTVDRPAVLNAAAGTSLQRMLGQATVVRRLFADKFVTANPGYMADLRAERDVPPRPRTLWPVAILGRHGLPLFTAGRYADEFLNPDPTKPRLDAPALTGSVGLHVSRGPRLRADRRRQSISALA
ncbi:hypothetical protein HH310_27285 [Actinoplanes sp. TBRC 11911]|uniref:hypothetical protein n=1 Tax=Actinoplanes sp. TBRC 11911 TaxID=2729386 RepID=UPI00145D4566|nr:hypothetical protein [Actinoplanes sp. TBRC 11911]NMO54875.1 hypothetical protein [Actinoplanes sp. TBRC 11911]